MVAIKSSLIALSYLAAFVTSAPSALNLRDTTINEPAVSSNGGTPVPIPDSVNNGNQYDSQSSSYGSGSSGSSSYGSGSSNSGSYGGDSGSGSYGGSGSNSGGYGSNNSGGYGGSGSSSAYGGSGNYGGGYSSSTSSTSMYEATSTSTSMYEPPMTTSSSMMMEESSSSMMEESSSTMMEEATSTSMYEASSTSSAYSSYSSPSYGSGSSNYGSGGGYNDCVNQCVASYGAPPSMYTPPASSGGSGSGSGKVWTVIVAPEQGVLRFVPFAVNASVGDTVRFVWGANVHTVTKSSVLEVCNKTSDAPFTSGIQNKTFTFDQVVNDTNPTFFYCGVPSHCQKGMFGIINPPNAAGSASSVSMMMPSAVSNNSDLSAQYSYTQQQTGGSEAASQWGMYMDVSKISASPDAQEQIYQNVMYTQLTMAKNPTMLTDGVLTPVGGTGLSVPDDITKITAASSPNSSTGTSGGSVVSSGATNAQGVANPEATTSKSAAVPRSVASSSGAIAISVVIAAFFAL